MVNKFNKYKVRQFFDRRLKEFIFLPRRVRYPLLRNTSNIEGDEIVLDEITKEKIYLWYFISSDIGYNLYFKGEFEVDEIRLIKNVVKKGDIVLDIGAYIGYHTLIMSNAIGEKGKGYTFEPYRKNFFVLEKNIKENQIGNIYAYKLAIGDKNKKIKLQVFDDYAYNSILNLKRKKYIGIENIEMVTLDSFVTSLKIKKIDLIKIDVEGFEFNTLIGAKWTLKKFKPKIICEIYQENLNPLKTKVRDVIDYVTSFGYKCYLIQGKKLVPVGSKKDDFQYQNFYFKSK